MKEYWHEISKEAVQEFMNSGGTVGDWVKSYKQPDWCSYPDALSGTMGCWSLTGDNRSSISKKFCKNCECFQP